MYIHTSFFQSECECECSTEIHHCLLLISCAAIFILCLSSLFFVVLEFPGSYLSKLHTTTCISCEGSWRMPPLRRDMTTLPCCLQESHQDCFNTAVMTGAECPSCGFPLNIEGVMDLQRAKGKYAQVAITLIAMHLQDFIMFFQ